MNKGLWIVIALAIVGIGWMWALPREEAGYISGEAGQCKIQMDIDPHSFIAYFKTFVCSETTDTKDCYNLVYDGGTCTTSYHYHETK